MHRLLRGLAVLAALPLIALPTAEAATVLMISPLTTNMQDELQGSMCETNTCVVVDAPAYPDPRGVIALDNAIKSTPGEIIVFGYSNGAQIVSQWLTQHANDPTAPSPDRLSFVLIGNPTRAYGGTSAPMPQTKYLVTDIAREYDVAADYPNNPKSRYYSLAVNNAWAGFFSIHANYWDVNQYDP
ncbi:MAG TPA: PE-PPE domain-containing protein, partial [Mycobacterium sp.]|nr:PE-PPE domain-containing protein [Mycobacterium sp.]